MTLGEFLKKERLNKGMTQKELSDKAEIDIRQYQNYEYNKNEPSYSILKQLMILKIILRIRINQ